MAREQIPEPDVKALLREQGIKAAVVSGEPDLALLASNPPVDLALIDAGSLAGPELRACVQRCSESKTPVVLLVPQDRLSDVDAALEIADFILSPPNPTELVVRAKSVLRRSGWTESDDVIRTGDLAINPTSYEVSLRGSRVALRFKEYELLRLLATNPGRVYSREALLSQIWGYDYFGGTRTVDVHIRRLRSKIEDADHRFIETIWNVGYRFRDVGPAS